MQENKEELKKALAKKALAEARKLDAEAFNATTLARTAVAEATTAEIALEKEQFKRQEELAANKYYHIYTFTDEVRAGSVKICIDQLMTWSRLEPKCSMQIIF